MPDAFFATQKPRKRKRTLSKADSSSSKSPKHARPANGAKKPLSGAKTKRRTVLDEDLGSDVTQGEDEDAGIGAIDDMDLRASDGDPGESGDEDALETPAEKRLRLARLYLDSVKDGLADGEFDAAEIDKELISARLKQDVAEHSGKVHLYVADSLDLSDAPTDVLRTRGHRFSVTAAVASEDGRMLFTAGKEGSIIKWDLRTGKRLATFPKSRIPKKTQSQGSKKGKERAHQAPGEAVEGHTDEVWALAISSDGKYLASGGKDRRVGVWDAEAAKWVRGFSGHKDSISALTFRKGTLQLYSASFDRTIKLFDLSVMGYVETLFGHQDCVQALDALRSETAVTVGGRDRTARFWKIVEETQLVFRGGGTSKVRDLLDGGALDGMDEDGEGEGERADAAAVAAGKKRFIEGSLQCVAMIDDTTFLSGGDSGTISLWSTQKKKPVFTQALAHGLNEILSATEGVIRTPRYITALASLRYSDTFASGSWEGGIRIWKLDDSKLRSFSLVGTVPAPGVVNSLQLLHLPKGALDASSWAADADSGAAEGGAAHGVNGNGKTAGSAAKARTTRSLLLTAALGQEPRLGRWIALKDVANGALLVSLTRRTVH